jgi:hypothetical protein
LRERDRNDGLAGETSQVTLLQRENACSRNKCATNNASTNRCGFRVISPPGDAGSSHRRGGKVGENGAKQHEIAVFFARESPRIFTMELVAF